jgi:hypothetical protein
MPVFRENEIRGMAPDHQSVNIVDAQLGKGQEIVNKEPGFPGKR